MKTCRRNKIAFHNSPLSYNIRWTQLIMQFSAPVPFDPITPLRSFRPCASLSAADRHQSNTHIHTHTHTHTHTVLPVTFSKETHTVTPTRYSSVGTVTTLQATRSLVWIPNAARIFLHSKLSRLAQFNGHRGSFPGVKQQTRYSDGKNEWSYTSTPPICPDGVDKHNCTLYWFRGVYRNKLFVKIVRTFHKETHSFLRKRFNRSLLVTRRKNGFHIKVAGEIFLPNTSLQTVDQLNTIRLHAASYKLEKRKSAGNIRTRNLEAISGQEIYRKYQDRKSTWYITTGHLQEISGHEVYRKYQDRKSTGNIKTEI